MEVCMNGSGSSAQIVSRSVGKGESSQVFHPKAVGNTKCHAHIQCDSIIMDHARVGSIPEIQANHVDAAIVHEAAIGRINDEQLLKLRTLGMTEAEAELTFCYQDRGEISAEVDFRPSFDCQENNRFLSWKISESYVILEKMREKCC